MTATAISTHGLTRRFGELTAVDHLDLEIPVGGVVGLVGPNGSGKSTTIRMLLGLVDSSEGTAEVLGEPITHPERYADRVGALIENPALVGNLSGRANVESIALLRGVHRRRVDEVLSVVGLSDRADDKVSTYSLGMKQRLGIAIALLPDSEILILDEPTNGLDPAGIVEVRGLLRRWADEGRTVVVSSHLLSEIEAAADYVVMIRTGRLLFAGPLTGLLNEAQHHVDVEPEHAAHAAALARRYREAGLQVKLEGSLIRVFDVPSRSPELNRMATDEGITLRRLAPRSETLEDVFLRMTTEKEGQL